MALESARRETVLELAIVREAIREARAARASGRYRDMVEAAGELTVLKRQRAMLKTRLAQIDRLRETHRTNFDWFRHTWFNLRLQFEDWIAHA